MPLHAETVLCVRYPAEAGAQSHAALGLGLAEYPLPGEGAFPSLRT